MLQKRAAKESPHLDIAVRVLPKAAFGLHQVIIHHTQHTEALVGRIPVTAHKQECRAC